MLSTAKIKLREAWPCKLKNIISIQEKSFLLWFVPFYFSRIFSGSCRSVRAAWTISLNVIFLLTVVLHVSAESNKDHKSAGAKQGSGKRWGVSPRKGCG